MPTSSGYINEKLGLFAMQKEVTAGLPNWSFTASGGSITPTFTLTVDTTDGLTDDNNIDSALSGISADFFNGAQVYFPTTTTTAALQGKVYTVTDFATVTPTATLTFASLDATPVNDDVFYLYYPLPASNLSLTSNFENIERDLVRQSLDRPSSLKGLKVASGSFDCEVPGMETVSTAIASAPVDRFSALLSCVGARRSVEGEAIVSGTVGASTCSVTNAATFAVDDLVMVNNEVRRVTVVNTTPSPQLLTWSPALSSNPIATDVIYGGEQWTPADYDHQTMTILSLTDDRLTEMRRCVLSLKSAAEFGGMLMFSFDFDAAYMSTTSTQDGWDLVDGFAMDGSQSSSKPPVFTVGAARHFGSTALALASFEFDLGHSRAEHRYSDSHFFTINERACTMTVSYKDSTVVPKETWESAGTVDALLVACGKDTGDCVAFYLNAQIQDGSSSENNNDFRDWSSTFGAVDDQTDAALAKRPLIVRF